MGGLPLVVGLGIARENSHGQAMRPLKAAFVHFGFTKNQTPADFKNSLAQVVLLRYP